MPKYTVLCNLIEKFRGELEFEASSPHKAQEKAEQFANEYGVSSDDDSQFNWDYLESEFEVVEIQD